MDIHAKVPKGKDKGKSLKKAVGQLTLKAENSYDIALLTTIFNEWLSPFSSLSKDPKWLVLLQNAANKKNTIPPSSTG